MNNEKQGQQENSILKRIGKGIVSMLKHILMSPVYLIRAIRWFVKYIYNSFTFSLRRSITANYIMLYIVVAIMTLSITSGGFLIHMIDVSINNYLEDVNTVVSRYTEGRTSSDELETQLNYIADNNECGFYLDLSDTTFNYTYLTDSYNDYEVPDNIWLQFRLLTEQKIYSETHKVFLKSESDNGTIYILQPIRAFYSSLSKLVLLLLVCLLLGAIFIGAFGNMNIRKIINPLYTMTLAAKKVSIKDMDERLDVSKAKYELRDLAITLNDMLDRLGEDYAKQKRFVSDVSHELRTPISIVNGYANMLERWGKKDEAILNESIDAIISEAKSMQLLVENLLTLVRSDNQTLQFDLSVFDVSELVSEVCKETVMINEKEQHISCNVKGRITVNLDFQKTKQMLRIFTDNAVKYTLEGGKIQIECYQENGFCFIHIRDTGIGIDKVDLPYLFDRFYRSDESRTRQTGGHGLGLSIAKVIVIGHGGTIKVKSKVNVGSEFIVSLPLYIVE